MRVLLALALLLPPLAGCTAYIPVKDDFGISAMAPPAGPALAGSGLAEIPPEFAEFNNTDPGVNPLLADQICATQYQTRHLREVGASTGRLIQATGRCATHRPLFGP